MSNALNLSEETLELLANGDLGDVIQKAITQATGLVNIDLQPIARELYPVITPLRNMLPRVGGEGGLGPNWRAVTAINAANVDPGVGEGQRNADVDPTVISYFANYKSLGFDGTVTDEAQYASEGFDDARARSMETTLRSLMVAEEKVLLGGNTSFQLGTTPTPTTSTSTTGGAISNGVVVSVICVGLTHQGYLRTTLASGVTAQISRLNNDGTTSTFGGGVAQVSAAGAPQTTGLGTTNSVSAYVVSNTTTQAPIGYVAYAWFWGTVGNETLGAITTINSVLITTATGTSTAGAAALASNLPAHDYSTNAQVYDGMLYLCMGAGQQNPAASASGSLVAVQATGTPGTGTTLTSDGAGGCVEINADFQSFWETNNQFLSPGHMFVGSAMLKELTKIIIAGGGAPLFRFNMDAVKDLQQGTFTAGAVIGSYLNPFSMNGGELCKIHLHPYMPAGMIFYYSDHVPYEFTNVGNIAQVKYRRDYTGVEWPRTTRKFQNGVYMSCLLQHYFPPSMGVRSNIA